MTTAFWYFPLISWYLLWQMESNWRVETWSFMTVASDTCDVEHQCNSPSAQLQPILVITQSGSLSELTCCVFCQSWGSLLRSFSREGPWTIYPPPLPPPFKEQAFKLQLTSFYTLGKHSRKEKRQWSRVFSACLETFGWSGDWKGIIFCDSLSHLCDTKTSQQDTVIKSN